MRLPFVYLMKRVLVENVVPAVLALVLSSYSFAVEVTNTAQLYEAVAARETDIVLNCTRLVLTSDLIIDYSCRMTPHQERSGIGGVIIDNNWHTVRLKNAHFEIGSRDPCNIITFTHGFWGCLEILSLGDVTFADIYYCRFEKAAGNGVSVLNGDYYLEVSFNHCSASENYTDGFNFHNYGDTALSGIVARLNNCEANDNGRYSGSAAAGDGVTGHNSDEYIIVNGGSFRNNAKSGFAMVSGARCYIYGGAAVEGNAWKRKGADIAGDESIIDVCDIRFSGPAPYGTAVACVWGSDSVIRISDCEFICPSMEERNFVRVGGNSTVNVENSVFCGGDGDANSISIGSAGISTIKNCTFYGNSRHIDMSGDVNSVISNNIFSNASTCAISGVGDFYGSNGLDGYNCFWANNQNIGGSGNDLLVSDIAADPLFAKYYFFDYHLMSAVGRWTIMYESNGDYNNDWFVDFGDFAIFALFWMQPDPPQYIDLDNDGHLDVNDLKIFCSRWLGPGENFSGWVQDDVNSPCIDTGDPCSPYLLEPAPNGGRINMGAYGNTWQASKSSY